MLKRCAAINVEKAQKKYICGEIWYIYSFYAVFHASRAVPGGGGIGFLLPNGVFVGIIAYKIQKNLHLM
jgi:hypothetical protein